jgi:hypothetical protein
MISRGFKKEFEKKFWEFIVEQDRKLYGEHFEKIDYRVNSLDKDDSTVRIKVKKGFTLKDLKRAKPKFKAVAFSGKEESEPTHKINMYPIEE